MTQPYTDEQIARWQRTARRLEEERRRANAARREAALAVAAKAAALLREQFGATRVVLYGSTARGVGFGPDSDIDLTAEGIAPERYWHACAALDYIDPQFEINVITFDTATPALLENVDREGIEL